MSIGCLLVFGCLISLSAAQLLLLKPGQIGGFEYETKSGEVAEVFLAIPFAEPPLNELRFEKPVPVKPWQGIRDGTAFGPTCHPHTRPAAVTPDPSEDCLTLNVIRPKKKAPPGGYPVLVWVHGGGYEIGSASLYGYKGIADIYVSQDIVVVTVQYRLGVYGFFSSGDARIPGNLGLFDMTAALKFVHENAAEIGVDASRLTVWGLSAGGAAAGQLILSPVSRDYVTRSIEMSGSPWSSWAMGRGFANNSLELAKELHCVNDLKNCMKSKSVDEIYDAVDRVCVKWGPVIDGEFILHPNEMSATAAPKDAIVGLSNKEASFFTVKGMSPFISEFGVKYEDFSTWNREKLVAKLKEHIRPEFYGNQISDAIDDIVSYYVNRGEEHSYEFYLDRFTEFVSDVLFNVAVVDGILARRQEGWNLYAYSFDHYNKAIWPENVAERLRGSPHVNEYPYIFDIFALGSYEIDEEEQIVADLIQQSFINFVKSGVPSNPHVDWKEVDFSDDLRYLSISPKPKMSRGFYSGATTFWHRMKKLGFDVISLHPSTVIDDGKDEL
ncbi:hypothetical protein Q1695_004544 [Nippostrongylus brasiliensis]|nr:hypothetical protein Q1695_004544 [Nippostrongylus brasiliensis]